MSVRSRYSASGDRLYRSLRPPKSRKSQNHRLGRVVVAILVVVVAY